MENNNNKNPVFNNTILSFISPCPGVGKSTLCKYVSSLFGNELHILSQDILFGKTKDACKKFKDTIMETLETTTDSIIIIDKNNHSLPVREATLPLEIRKQNRTIYIVMSHPKGKDSCKITAYNRIAGRTNHPTLDKKDAYSAITIMARDYSPLTADEIKFSQGIINIDITKSRLEILKYFCEQLVEYNILEDVPTDAELEQIVKDVK